MKVRERIQEAFRSPDLRACFANIAWLSGEKLIQLLNGLIIGLWIARHVGPQAYGQFHFALAWIGLCCAIAWVGVGDTVIRDLVRDPSRESFILGSAFAIRLGGSLLAVALTIGLGYYSGRLDETTWKLVCIICIGVPLGEITGGVLMWFQSRMDIKMAVIARNVAVLAAVGVRIALLLSGADIVAFAWAMVVEACLYCALIYLSYWLKGGNPFRWRFSGSATMAMLKDGFPLIISSLIAQVNGNVDKLMLGWLTDFQQVGLYAAATRFSEIWWIVPPILMQSLSPRYIFPSNLGAARERNLVLIMTAMLSISLIPVLAIALFGEPVMLLILGERFAAAVPVLLVHIWIAVFIFIDAPASQYLVATNRQRLLVWKSLGAIVINAALNYALVPRWGAVGASLATLIAYLWAAIIYYAVNPLLRDVSGVQFQSMRYLLFGWWPTMLWKSR